MRRLLIIYYQLSQKKLSNTSAFSNRLYSIKFLKNKKLSMKYDEGFSLIELLVVISIFVALAIISTQIIAVTITGSRKTESLTKVRENVDFSFAVMERKLRNATSVDCSTSTTTQLDYVDEDGVSSNFSCVGGLNGYIARDGNRITSDTVSIDCTEAVFTCTDPSGTVPPSVDIFVNAQSSEIQDEDGAFVSTSTKILLRSF